MSNSPGHPQLNTRKLGRRIWLLIRSHLGLFPGIPSFYFPFYYYFPKANLNRPCKLKVTCSNSSALSKLDALGASYNEALVTAKERISKDHLKLRELKERATAVTHACSGTCVEGCLEAQTSSLATELLKQHQLASHPGFTIAFAWASCGVNGAENHASCWGF